MCDEEIKEKVLDIAWSCNNDRSLGDISVSVKLTDLVNLINEICEEVQKEPSMLRFNRWLSEQVCDISTDRKELLVIRNGRWLPAINVFLQEQE